MKTSIKFFLINKLRGERMRLKSIITLLLLALFFFGVKLNAQEKLIRYPAVNPAGTEIAFSYQGDIWTVNINGGEAFRRTVHPGYDYLPVYSPDGKQIAFTSNRFGNDDLFVIPAEGGQAKRLTYYSSADELSDWSDDGQLFFTTTRLFKQVEWSKEIYVVNANGGTPYRFLNAVGFMPAKSPDGKFLAFVRGACRLTREAYHGPANKDIWLYDIAKDKYIQLTTYNGNDFYPKWGKNGELYFISSRNGRYNIFKLKINESGKIVEPPTAVTRFKDSGVRYFDISGNGKVIVFEKLVDIYKLTLNDNSISRINVKVGTDSKLDAVAHKTFTGGATDYSVSPSGNYLAFVVRGEIFVKLNKKKKSKAVNLTNSPARDMNPQWLNDSTIIFLSDRSGEYDLYSVASSDPQNTSIYGALSYSVKRLTNTDRDESELRISPNRKKIAFVRGRGKLIVASLSKDGKITKEVSLLNGWATPGGIAWSPDSKWLAYSLDDLYFNSEVYIQPADNSKKPINVSMHPKGDYSPVWSPDGSKLGFISQRNNNDNDVWFVWLRKKDWEKSKADWRETGEKIKPDKKKNKIKELKIDLENIWQRLTQVTSLPGDENNLAISKDGKYFYFTAIHPPSKGRDLFSIKWDGSEMKALTKGGQNPGGVELGGKGKYLYYFKSGGRLARLKTKGGKIESLPFKAKMDINFKAEKDQIFEEAWRTLNAGFYDPNFHGRDWKALKKKYKPICLSASTDRDFRDMFNEMLGQLDASHMGLYGRDREKTQREITGKLGAELKPNKYGLKVIRVVPESPADKDFSKLNVGDVIIAVDGKKISPAVNFYKYLINKANEKVALKVTNGKGKTRRVIVRLTSSLKDLLYKEWVNEEKKLTEKYSKGRLGYIHIQGMNWPSFERFERELTASGLGKEGLVIDVRFNGGGWTTDYLMTVLNVKQHAYTIPRGATKSLKAHKKFRDYYPFSERLPYAPWIKPSIAMCNSRSYSNAEIFSHAYKTLGIGKLVGEPTFGAVISTGGKRLIDGSFVRLPFRAWYVKATDKNMEYGPAVPDIIVYNNPDDKAKGRDTQLKAAVRELLKEIDSKK